MGPTPAWEQACRPSRLGVRGRGAANESRVRARILERMRYLAFLRRNPSAGLLFVQILGVVLYPLMETSPRGRTLFQMFGLLVLGLALWVVRRSPSLTWLAVLL